MTTAECIHGLALGECEVCTPREAPVATAQSARTTARAPRTGGVSAKPATAPTVAVRPADGRRYLVLAIDELDELLGASPLVESHEWRLELPAPTSRDRVVVVSTLDDPDAIVLLGVANEPARRVVADTLRSAGRSARVVVNPAWFA